MHTSFTTRSAAARAAMSAGHANFMTLQMSTGWRMVPVQGASPAAEYAKGKDFVRWVESRYVDEGRQPGLIGVLVVSCFKHELPDDVPSHLIVEPQTPSLWDSREDARVVTQGSVLVNGRVRSEVESPVKTVWRIADEMKGQPRADIIAACIAAGVNKSTANTQFYKWGKAQTA